MSSPASYLCFSSNLLQEKGMSLHLSTGCNLLCSHCVLDNDSRATSSLGRTGMTIMTPDGAFDLLRLRMEAAVPPSRVVIAGLGEPLLDAGTFILMRQLHAAYPDLPVSVWTNGILFSDRLEELVRSGLRGVVFSIHATTQETADAFYNWVIYRGRRKTGRDASHLILRRQWKGLSNAVEAGIETTVYTMRIRGVNDHEIDRIAAKARSIGADRIEIVDVNR